MVTPVVATPLTVRRNPPVQLLLMIYDLLLLGRIRLLAAVIAPLRFKIAYCPVVEPMLVAALVPCVLVRVTFAVVIVTAKPPAMAMSKYAVMALFTSSPQVPDSVPVTGRPRDRLVV